MRELRKIEQEVLGSEKLKKNAQHHSSSVENSNLASKIDECAASMQGLIKRMDGLERKVENNARSGQHFQSGSRARDKVSSVQNLGVVGLSISSISQI